MIAPGKMGADSAVRKRERLSEVTMLSDAEEPAARAGWTHTPNWRNRPVSDGRWPHSSGVPICRRDALAEPGAHRGVIPEGCPNRQRASSKYLCGRRDRSAGNYPEIP